MREVRQFKADDSFIDNMERVHQVYDELSQVFDTGMIDQRLVMTVFEKISEE